MANRVNYIFPVEFYWQSVFFDLRITVRFRHGASVGKIGGG